VFFLVLAIGSTVTAAISVLKLIASSQASTDGTTVAGAAGASSVPELEISVSVPELEISVSGVMGYASSEAPPLPPPPPYSSGKQDLEVVVLPMTRVSGSDSE
jgi:hypothetical protein